MVTRNGTSGNDTLTGTEFADSIIGFAGNDSLLGLDGNDSLDGGNGIDILNGRAGNDSLNGGGGNDTLYGEIGIDILTGGAGNDTYIIGFDDLNDTITETANAGIETVQSYSSYTLSSNLENLTLKGFEANGTGNSLNNTIIGDAGNNRLNGLTGNDTLNGWTGDDTLIGGAGNDIFLGSSASTGDIQSMTGGAGRDKFILGDSAQVFYDDRNTATAGTGGYALIKDFDITQDVIQLNGRKTDYLLKASPSGNPPSTAIYRNKPTGEPDELIAIIQGSPNLNLNGNHFRFIASAGIYLSDLNGSNGFVLKGINADDKSGFSVSSAGDINGDGFDDLLIGAPGAYVTDNGFGYNPAGATYVVFGKAGGFGSSINLSALNGTNGFVLAGVLSDSGSDLGSSVSSAGDINGDGFDDLILGAPEIGSAGYVGFWAGSSYVVFGKEGSFNPRLSVYDLNGSNGFTLSTTPNSFESQRVGESVSSAGDINSDGFDDLIVGTSNGSNYVVFGKAESISGRLLDLNGSDGFAINGASGIAVSSAGDFNGDGFDDLLIGSTSTGFNSQNDAGRSYVVFGKAAGFAANFNLSQINGSNGFAINGINAGDRLGFSVSDAGDINGDGFSDIIIAANGADPNGQESAGQSYVVFGKAGGFGANLNLSTLDGSNGFAINGIDAGDSPTLSLPSFFFSSSTSVSSAGDINGDGFDDLLIGAPNADPNSISSAGESYVVFGKAGGFAASFNLFNINSSNGLVLNGIDAYDFSGDSVSSVGDINGDGFDDLIVGASGADPNGQSKAGESYVIFGRDFTNSVTRTGTAGNDTLTGTTGNDILVGGLGNDRLIGGMGIDVLYGGAGDDILSFGAIDRRLNGGSGTDTLRIDTSGINMDLRAIANNKITEFELIDLTGTGNNSLNFTRLDLLALSDTTNQLIINGNAGDTATSTGQGWTPGGTTTLNRILYDRYTVGAATLLVDADITQTII